MRGRHYTADELAAWQPWFDRLGAAGPYHAPTYLDVLAGDFEFETERAELFVYGTEEAFVYYPFLRRDLAAVPAASEAFADPAAYSDVVSSWYYGGPLRSPDADERVAREFADAFGEFCREEGILTEFVRFDPNLENHAAFDVLAPTFERETVRIDLGKSEAAIWDDYEARNQRAIKQARASPLEIEREYDGEDLENFQAIYANAMAARDAADHYRFSLDFFERLLATDLFSLVVARYDEEVVGGFVVAHDDTYSHHYLSASNPDYWDDRVNNLLYHEVVMYMHETGRELFDFQGGRPGVFKFKKGFSSDRGEFHVAKRVHDEDRYEELVEGAAARGVETDTGYFPAYRVEQSN